MAGDYDEHEVEVLLREGALLINDGYRAKNSELSNTGIPFARAGNIDGGFHFEDADRVPAHTLAKVGLKRSLPGDVVFTSKGTVGRFAFVRVGTPEFVYSPQLCYWRSGDVSRIHPRWLFYWMTGREFFLQFKGVAGQTDMAEYVSLRDQRAMKITLPPLAEQKAIAAVLGTLDDKIELNRRMNATLEAMARALFQSWFVDFDPVRAKLDARKPVGMDEATAALFPNSFEYSKGKLIPAGWEIKSIADVTERVTKGDTPRNTAMEAAPPDEPLIRMLRVNAITELGEILYEKLEYIPESIHFGKSRRSILQENDILYTNAGTIGRVAFVQLDLLPANTNQAIAIVRPDVSRVTPAFLFMVMRQPEFQEVLHYDIVQAVQANLALGKISDAKAVFPPAMVMPKLFAPIQFILNRIWNNRRESRTLAILRDTLLPKLLSGEIAAKETS